MDDLNDYSKGFSNPDPIKELNSSDKSSRTTNRKLEICPDVGHGLICNCKNIKEDDKLNNNQKEFVIVPQSDIDKLEKARLYLFEIIKNDSFLLSKILFGVSDVMWEMTHRKYSESKTGG